MIISWMQIGVIKLRSHVVGFRMVLGFDGQIGPKSKSMFSKRPPFDPVGFDALRRRRYRLGQVTRAAGDASRWTQLAELLAEAGRDRGEIGRKAWKISIRTQIGELG